MIKGTVSNLIKPEDIKDWGKGDIITIKAGTGDGKSYFIKNRLYASAKKENKKILMLIHRVNCVNQFKDEIKRDGKEDIIDIKTYQSIDYIYSIGGEFDFSKYEYIVSDEFHYFMSDASFNKTTDISLNVILDQTECIRIFMSATGDYMSRYIKNLKQLPIIEYELDIDYNFITELNFFNKDETMEDFADECIERNEKAIFFIQSATKAYNLHKKYKKHSMFNCGESDKHYKYVDENKIKNLLIEEGFTENILITTTAFDAGVNITTKSHKEVGHIVLDVEDEGVLIQCLGRRRIDKTKEDDGIVVYIKNINNNRLGGLHTQINKRIEKAEYFKDYGNVAYTRKYGRNPDVSAVVYEEVNSDGTDTVKRLNELMYYKSLIDAVNIQLMSQSGYMNYMSKLLGNEYIIIEERKESEDLEVYLNRMVGKKLHKKEQEKLKKAFRNNGLKSRTVGFNTINGNMRDRGLQYILTQGKRGKYKDDNGEWKNEKSHWILEQLQ